jgi:hypothetical protein
MPRLRAASCSSTSTLACINRSVSLSVQIEDERGVRDGEPWWRAGSTAAIVGEHPGTCCLRFIDPYGDTVFNQAQIPVLLSELRALGARAPRADVAALLDDLCAFIERAVDHVHTYVRFIGD